MKKILLLLLLSVSAIAQRTIEQKNVKNLADSLAKKIDKVAGKALSTNDYTTTEKTKLAGVATGATANSTDATLLSRANHTGTQTSSTISDFNTAADARVVAGITGKENTITVGTTAQYYRGDKSFQTLDKTAVGLGNVDNTSDANKPVSTATQTALNLKANLAGDNNFTGVNAFTGTTATDTAPLGTELLTSSNWTSTGWTGSFATGWVHTTGNTTVLSNTLAASNATYYQIAYTVTGRTVGTFDISFGGVNTTGLSSTGATGILTTSTGTLSITPTSTFDGTIVISIKTIGTSTALVTYKNSSGAIINEVRNTTSNTFYGVNSGRRITTGSSNTAIGQGSLTVNTTGNDNTAIGSLSLGLNTTGTNNTAIGVNSLYRNTTGNSNSALGGGSLGNNTTGIFNSAFGSNSLLSNTTANGNSAFGLNSLSSNTIGASNTSIGINSLFNSTTGSNNIALGSNAARYILGGSVANTTTNNSIFLGANTYPLADNQTNQTVIGYGAVGNGSNTTVLGNTSTTQTQIFGNTILSNTSQATDTGERLQVNGTARFVNGVNLATTSGSVGIGTTAPTSKLQVVGLPVYENNTLALAGGLTAGAFYRTSVGVLMVAF